MLRHIHLETMMFGPGDDEKETRKDLSWLLEGLTWRNAGYLKARPDTPRLYKSGVVYRRPKQFTGDCDETKILKAALGKSARNSDVRKALDLVQAVLGGEHFCDIGVILEMGAIDCDGLACFRAAELRQAGIKASPYLTHRKRWDGGTTYHALVIWPPFGPVTYTTTEDPSLLLGMGGKDREKDRLKEIRKNQERCDILRGMKNGASALFDGDLHDGDLLLAIDDAIVRATR